MPAPRKTEVREAVKRLLLEGKSMVSVAADVGVTYATVIHHTRSLMENGEVPRVRNRRRSSRGERGVVDSVRYRHNVSFGRMGSLVASLSDEQIDWLIAQMPKGGTMADALRSIIVDAHAEDTE
jgi:hypothetical protein